MDGICLLKEEETEIKEEITKVKEELDHLWTDDYNESKELLELVPAVEDSHVNNHSTLPCDSWDKSSDQRSDSILPDLPVKSESHQNDITVNISKDLSNWAKLPKEGCSEWILNQTKEDVKEEVEQHGISETKSKSPTSHSVTNQETMSDNFVSENGSHVAVSSKVLKQKKNRGSNQINHKKTPDNDEFCSDALNSETTIARSKDFDVLPVVNVSHQKICNAKDNIKNFCHNNKNPTSYSHQSKRSKTLNSESTKVGNEYKQIFPSLNITQDKVPDSRDKIKNSYHSKNLTNPQRYSNIYTKSNLTKNKLNCLVTQKNNLIDDIHSNNDSEYEDGNLVPESSIGNEEIEETPTFSRDNVDYLESDGGGQVNVHSSLLTIADCQNIINFISRFNTKHYSCNVCKKQFKRPSILSLHQKSKCGSLKLFSCNICSKGFTAKASLNGHLNTVHNELHVKRYKCDICDKLYKSKISLKKHKLERHKEEQVCLPQTCEICQKSFSSATNLNAHIKRTHRHIEGEYFECAHCEKTFFRKYLLIFHMKYHHLPSIRCAQCKGIYSTQENLRTHMQLYHCEERKLICDLCGKKFRHKDGLVGHMRIHTNEKPFMCQICGKCFRTESNLTQHSVTHSDVRPFGCDYCSKSFRIKNHLRQHMAVHGMANTSVSKKNHNKS